MISHLISICSWRALALLMLASCSPAMAGQPPEPELRAAIQYGLLPAQQGDIFLPSGDGRQRRAAILVVHGGGWIGGSRTTNAGLSRFLATEGFVVFNIDYRLAIASVPTTHWPAQLEDCELALRWLKLHAEVLRVDPNRIGAVGDSVGGTLAVLLGVVRTGAPRSAADRPAIAAVVDQFGIMDLAALGSRAKDMNEGLFGRATAAVDQVQSVSPIPAVTGASAPMLIVHGTYDDFVPLRQSQDLVTALTSHGVAAQLIAFAGGHGFAGMSGDAIAALFTQEAAWLRHYLGS